MRVRANAVACYAYAYAYAYMGRTVGVNISSNASAPNDAFQYVLRVYNRFYRNILVGWLVCVADTSGYKYAYRGPRALRGSPRASL